MIIQLAAREIFKISDNFSGSHLNLSRNDTPVNIFVRQQFTNSNNSEEKEVIQDVFKILAQIDQRNFPIKFVDGLIDENQEIFNQSSTQASEFYHSNPFFHHLKLLNQADAMIIIRTSLIESSILEMAYNIFASCKMPMFFAVWRNAPIKNMLIRDLDELCANTYVTFDKPDELRTHLLKFLAQIPTYYNLTA